MRSGIQPFAIGLALVFLLRAAYAQAGAQASVDADVILRNGKIVTIDQNFSIAQAIAIRGESILAVGSNAEVGHYAGPRTKIVDLAGKTVIPGLIDDHYHMLSKAVDQYLGVEIALVPSIVAMQQAIKQKADSTPVGETIYTTSGWLPTMRWLRRHNSCRCRHGSRGLTRSALRKGKRILSASLAFESRESAQ